MQRLLQWITGYKFILSFFIILSIGASIQALLLPPAPIKEGKGDFTAYNNFIIFKQSFYHLIGDKDLYVTYPDEYWDLYKYSPAFALLFGIFAVLPDSIGLLLWNGLNVVILVIAIYFLPKLTTRQKGFILLACTFEIMTSLQNEQSNGLMAGLIILAFGFRERNHLLMSTLCLMLSVYIKLFGIVGFALFLFYPQKVKVAGYALMWAIILMMLPLLVVDIHQLFTIYQSWWHLLATDQPPTMYGYSIFGWLKSWFHFRPGNVWVLGTGVLIFLFPYLRLKMYPVFDFKLLALSSMLIWMVIFNHMAESPTFVIAMAGVSIWFFTRTPSAVNTILFSLAMLLTSLSATDIFSHDFRNLYVKPYVLKAFPCIIIWLKIVVDMVLSKNETESSQSVQPSHLKTI